MSNGMDMTSTRQIDRSSAGDATAKRGQITIIGIGDDGWAGLGAEAQMAISQADHIVGGRRHLSLVPIDGQTTEIWQQPFGTSIDDLAARSDGNICVLASGDPLLFGVGSLLIRRIEAERLRIIPHVSTLALVCARMLC